MTAGAADVACERRAAGRPRSTEVDEAILRATWDLLAEAGADALTIGAVAARAGVGKAAIYRRFRGRESLIIEALQRLNSDLPDVPDEGTTRERLRIVLTWMRDQGEQARVGRIGRRIAADGMGNPGLLELYRARVFQPRLERVASVLRDGIARGEVRADIDPVLAATCVAAPMVMAITWLPASETRAMPEGIVELLLTGLSPGLPASDS